MSIIEKLMEGSIMDFTKLRWQLNIAILGAVFSVFSLIYNDYYIYYGFVTFLYGAVANLLGLAAEHLFKDKSLELRAFFVSQGVCLIAWVIVLVLIY